MSDLKNCNIAAFFYYYFLNSASIIQPEPPFSVSQTFQCEDAISQGINNVIERSFIGHIEKVLLFGVAGDRLDLFNERLWVLLPPDVMTQNLEAGVRGKKKGGK